MLILLLFKVSAIYWMERKGEALLNVHVCNFATFVRTRTEIVLFVLFIFVSFIQN